MLTQILTGEETRTHGRQVIDSLHGIVSVEVSLCPLQILQVTRKTEIQRT